MQATVEIPENVVPGGWIFGADLRITDAVTPNPLVLRAPSFAYPRSPLEFTLGEGVTALGQNSSSKLKQLIGKGKRGTPKAFGDSKIVFDARYDANQNVAHILQGQMGPLLAGLAALGIEDRVDDVVFVVSADTPDYAQALFRAFGFEVHASDANVSGALLKMTPFKFRFRPYGVPFLRKRALQLGLVSDPNPKSGRLYIARVGRRTATNEADVSKVLEQRGFERVLAEDLTIEEQIRRIAGAEIIFAMHGAAMGFMQLRDPAQAGVVIETCSVGYTSNWARAIASRAGDTWFGMQGKWDPKHVTDLLQGAPPRTHEAASYELSVPMVEQAVTLAELTVSKGAALTADEVLAHIPPIRL